MTISHRRPMFRLNQQFTESASAQIETRFSADERRPPRLISMRGSVAHRATVQPGNELM